MKLLPSILVGVCAAPLAAIIVGTAADSWASWLRISPRDGAAGYWVVMMALLGALIALIVGISIARGWLLSTPHFWSALGTTVGLTTAATLVITGLIRLAADLPPKIDGRPLDLVAEIRFPAGTTVESFKDATPYVSIMRSSSRDSRGSGNLDFESAREVDGHLVIPVTMDIYTSAKEKRLVVGYPDGKIVTFPLQFGSTPAQKDLDWTDWITAEAPGQAFAMRYKVVVEPPPAPRLTREQETAQVDAKRDAELAALPPDAPLARWLVFTGYGHSQPRVDAAVAKIRARPDWVAEMTHEMLDGKPDVGRDALRAVQHFKPLPPELAPGLVAVGNAITQTLLEIEKQEEGSERYNALVIEAASRFSAWMDAVRPMQEGGAGDFIPQLKEIIEPARRLQTNAAIRIDVVRVASFYLNKWAGIAPLPTDPPPR